MMNVVAAVAVGATLAFGLSSCGRSAPSDSAGRYSSLIADADRLQERINLGHVMRASAPVERADVLQLLSLVKVGLMRLDRAPNDAATIRATARAIAQIRAMQLPRQDRDQLMAFVNDVGAALAALDSAYGLNALAGLTWQAFAYRFSAGLEPFTTSSTATEWKADWSLDERSFATVGGFENRAWLLSPTFDLSRLQRPSFRFRHAVMINRNTGSGGRDPYDRRQILANAFKVMVSKDYAGGDPARATWTRVDPGPMPSSYDFHTVDSAEIDLSSFAGAGVTVAFLYDMDRSLGRHYVTWQIYGFELFGLGEARLGEARPRVLAEHAFKRDKLDPFQQFAAVAGGAAWEPFAVGGNFRFAKIFATGPETRAWLLSPLFKLADRKRLSLVVKEAVYQPRWDNMRIRISRDYKGGDPEAANWETLARTTTPDVPERRWKDAAQGPFDLSAYAGQDVAVAFQFVSEAGLANVGWEIESLQISGIGDALETAPLSPAPASPPAAAPPTPPVAPAPAPPPAPAPASGGAP